LGLWRRSAPDTAGGGVEVGSVQPGSPAERAGVLAGDVVVRVDDTDVAGADVPTVATLLRGPSGSTVRVAVRRGSATQTVRLARATFSTDDVTVERLAGGISRISVTAFTRGVGRDVAKAMATERSVRPRGVVLDLRDNPGGLLDEAVSVASVFLDGGPVVSYERRGARPRTLDAFEGGDTTTPLVVLVNPSTASAAEVVAGALQDRNRAVVVGTRTYGKGSVQEPSKLSDGSALELTVGRYLTPSGRSLDGVGIEPDVLVPPGAPPAVAERRAIDVLTGLVAALGGTGRG
jgi:carboxyl-terminal processing protease